MREKKRVKNMALSVVFSIISILWLFPTALVVINSFEEKAHISRKPFAIPTGKMFVGLDNYINDIKKTDFVEAFGWTLLIAVGSVAAIILRTSMCVWYVSRVKNAVTTTIYYLYLFPMIVLFWMVMFPLSKIADMLKLNIPWGLIAVYLGSGVGLAVFIFTGFVKSIPLEIEKAAMIDGCTPIQTFSNVALPIVEPTCVMVAILQAMWIWNDYPLPCLILDLRRFKTISTAVQYLKDGCGSTDIGAMMGVLVLAIIPIIVLYLVYQKHIIEGVVTGAIED